jgi:ABC-type multidrug transport system ATPase subunit
MVRDADHVIVLSAGEIVEQGTPQELLNKQGWFAAFANATESEQTDAEETEQSDDEEEEIEEDYEEAEEK